MHPIECASISEMRDARCRVSSSRHQNRFPRAIRDLILSPERQKMRRGSPTKLQKSHPRRFTLARAYVFLAPCGKNKIKKATERLRGREHLGASRQKGFPTSKILRSRAQRNNQGFETLALSLVFFLQLLPCLNSCFFLILPLSKTRRWGL